MKPMRATIAFLLIVPWAALGWSPKTDQAVVSTAVRLLSKGKVIQLSKLDKDVMEGASVAPETMARLLPGLATSPVAAIQAEMYLLDAVRGSAIDPYFAYRFGVLGRLVAQITAPLTSENAAIRARYYADVEKALPQTPLKPHERKKVEPLAYFEQLQRAVDSRKDLIIKDYQSGPGFDGVARASISDEITRSIDAVADVWYTILTQRVVQAGVSDSQKHDYVVQAMAFYVARGSEDEIDLNYRRLTEAIPKTPDMAKQVADLLYDAGMAERAVKEYQEVLAAEPHRKDVVDRISGYYMEQGELALKGQHLEQALEAYTQAAKADPLHPSAEAKRLEVEKLIADRDARLQVARSALEEGGRLESEAEQLILAQKLPEAFDALQKAQAAYESVTDEFRQECQAASAGIANISVRLRELKSDLTTNAQTLSGSGFRLDIQKMAAAADRDTAEKALHKITAHQLSAEMAKLKAEYQNVLAGNK